MKIVELRAENVKRLKAVCIRPDGNVVTISGENGAGKSSTLDAIMYALAGKGSHPPEVIRRGEERAQVVVELDDLVVERRWTATTEHMVGGTTLEVRSKDGAKFPSPQAMLDKLVGELSFDPLAFLRLEPKKQAATLRELVGLDTTAIDAAHAALFAKRTAVTAVGKDLRARFDGMPAPGPGVPAELVKVDELLDQQAKLQTVKDANDKVRAEAQRACDAHDLASAKVPAAGREIEMRERELERVKAELETARERFKQAQELEATALYRKVEAREAAEKLVDPDFSELYRRIKTAESTNVSVRAGQARAQLGEQLTAKRAEKEDLNKQLEVLERQKEQLFAAAKFPVPGLAFTADGLTLNGLPLEQASSAERLRVSLAMGLALNPKLKVVLIRDGSLLDKKSLQMVGEMATAADAQVWLEKVAAGERVGIVIEDGQLAALHEAAEESAA